MGGQWRVRGVRLPLRPRVSERDRPVSLRTQHAGRAASLEQPRDLGQARLPKTKAAAIATSEMLPRATSRPDQARRKPRAREGPRRREMLAPRRRR